MSHKIKLPVVRNQEDGWQREVRAALEKLVAAFDLLPTTARWTSGAGTPEDNVIGNVGDLYTRTDGGAITTLYVKTSGSGKTGWTAK